MLYAGAVVLPLAAAVAADPFTTVRPFRTEFSVAVGLMALPLLIAQFVLVSRLGRASELFGSDALMQMHRGMGVVLLALVAAHALLLPEVGWQAWSPFAGPVGQRAGAAAFWTVMFVAVTSLARRRLRLQYEAWQIGHLLGAVLVVSLGLWHAFRVGGYTGAVPVRYLLVGYAAIGGAVLLQYRVLRPLRLARRPWVVTANRPIGGSTRLLRLEPVGHDGLRFQPGQFAWLATGRRLLWSAQHPLSIASSAGEPSGAVEFAVKALGDWSSDVVPALAVGQRLRLDGPFGAFTLDRVTDARGLVLIAGGIGVAPMRSMLRTMADRGDGRPVLLLYAASNWSRVVFRDELRALEDVLDLRVVYVFERPDESWTGERGYVTAEVVRRHLPGGIAGLDFFVCGPRPMMRALERALLAIRVPSDRIHTEHFQMV